jgi:hypothetical protein
MFLALPCLSSAGLSRNCIYAASGIVTPCRWLSCAPVKKERQIAITVWQITDAVDTVVCAPDDGRRYHPKHVEQFSDINKLCNVASCWIYILEYIYDARTHKRKKNTVHLNVPSVKLNTWDWTRRFFWHGYDMFRRRCFTIDWVLLDVDVDALSASFSNRSVVVL